MDHLAGHLVVRRIVGIVKRLIRLQHLGRGDDQARAYSTLQMVFLQRYKAKLVSRLKDKAISGHTYRLLLLLHSTGHLRHRPIDG